MTRPRSAPKVPDERLAKFLDRFAVSEREAALKDVAELKSCGPEASWRVIDSVCLSAADILSMRADRVAVMLERDAPHPSFEGIMKRLRARYRNTRP